MKKNILLISLTCVFVLLLMATTFVSFSGNIDEGDVVVKSITPLYDETSTVVVDNEDVTFNDKNQVVDYKVVVENKEDYDVKINNISLTTPTEEFLSFKVEEIEDEVLKANSTKEITISLETMDIKGWGRNFEDELITNISFEKVVKQEEPTPPTEETPKEEDKPAQGEVPKEDKEETSKPSEGGESEKPIKQPEAPVKNDKELIKTVEKIEQVVIKNDSIELPKEIKINKGEKIAVWIYSEPIFLGYFDVVEENGIKKIEGLEEALDKAEIKSGAHNIVLVSNEVTLGYVSVYVDESKQLLSEKVEEENVVENPYTSDNILLIELASATVITGIVIIVVSNRNVTKYIIFVLMLTPALTTNAEESIELSITLNVSFQSQNVMKAAYALGGDGNIVYHDYWAYNQQIKNFYIQTEKSEIKEYIESFDVTEEQNGRVMAYLVKKDSMCSYSYGEEIECYNLYLQADGIIYPNSDMSYYFSGMDILDSVNNLGGFDTSEVTNMSHLFTGAGQFSENFSLDVSSFDTSKVTDMSNMFAYTGYNSYNFDFVLGENFDTSNVTTMSHMFDNTGKESGTVWGLGKKFDTSKVTDMRYMFAGIGFFAWDFTLNLGDKFDTSNVTDMSYMFSGAGYFSDKVILNLGDKFDTSKVTDMRYMFSSAGYFSSEFELDLGDKFDTSNVTNMNSMFLEAGYTSSEFDLDLGNKFDTGEVTDLSNMFMNMGYNSTKINVAITIKNSNVVKYDYMFYGVAVQEGASFRVNYTSETEDLVVAMLYTRSSGGNVIKGDCVECQDGYIPIGAEIDINGEKFNVISRTDDTVTMLAQYNIGSDYRQSTTENYVSFSDSNGWLYGTDPHEIDVQEWGGNSKTLLNNYVSYLENEYDVDVTGDFITLSQLGGLGCTIPVDYKFVSDSSGRTCADSIYKSWLVNGQKWWTRSSYSDSAGNLWVVLDEGIFNRGSYRVDRGVRPVITISKETLKNLN